MPAPSLTVRDYMSSNVATIRENVDIAEAVRIFTENNIYGAVVVNNLGNVVGILSVSDFIYLSVKQGFDAGWRANISEVMSADVRTVEACASIMDVAKLFMENNYRRYPVMDDNRLVGIVTRLDVLKALAKITSSGVAV